MKFQKTTDLEQDKVLARVDQNEIILQSLSEGVCRLNAKGEIVYANDSAKRMLETQKATDAFYGEIFFGKNRELFSEEIEFCPIQFVLDSGETSHVSSEVFYSQDGTKIQVEYVCVPLVEEGKTYGAVISFQDISERAEAEKAVAEARDFALEAANTKAMFLANMSHEIRTPLNGVIGTANLLSDTNLTDEQQNYVQMLKQSSDLLRDIVTDILDFSKFEAGKFELEKNRFKIRELAWDAVGLFSTPAHSKELKLDFEIDKDIPAEIFGDANKIRQVLINLIGNAIKFTEKGSVFIRVGQSKMTDTEIVLLFEVIDSGIGIDSKTQEQLFQPFTQADPSTTRIFGGTGLGLAISKGIVEMMSGEIGVESEKHKGSRFWFTVELERFAPLEGKVIESIQDKKLARNEKSKKKKLVKKRSLKILIVEDNSINREVALKTLNQIGFEAESAVDGVEALKVIGEGNFDLVFMDCQMPRMDGYKTTLKIREFATIEQPIIIALTASIDKSVSEKCRLSGMDGYISKPFEKKDIEDAISQHFDSRDSGKNLDLDANIVQHSLNNIIDLIEPKRLESFLRIEAGGKSGFTREILGLYVENTSVGIAEIFEAFKEKNRESIKRKSHTLKGSSANVGLGILYELFEELELALKDGNWSEIEVYIKKISKEFEDARSIIIRI